MAARRACAATRTGSPRWRVEQFCRGRSDRSGKYDRLCSISRLNSKPASRKQSFRSEPSFSIRSLVAAGSGTSAPAQPWRFSTRKRAWGGKKRAFIGMAKLLRIPTPLSGHSLADLTASLPEMERRRRLRRLTVRWDSRYWGGLEQQPPPGEWRKWLLLAGKQQPSPPTPRRRYLFPPSANPCPAIS